MHSTVTEHTVSVYASDIPRYEEQNCRNILEFVDGIDAINRIGKPPKLLQIQKCSEPAFHLEKPSL